MNAFMTIYYAILDALTSKKVCIVGGTTITNKNEYAKWLTQMYNRMKRGDISWLEHIDVQIVPAPSEKSPEIDEIPIE